MKILEELFHLEDIRASKNIQIKFYILAFFFSFDFKDNKIDENEIVLIKIVTKI